MSAATTVTRDDALTTAAQLINGDRARDYGDAAENFARIGALVTPILAAKLRPGERVEAHEVALILTQLKVARLITSPKHADSWIDAAGYIALGAEVATVRRPDPGQERCAGCKRVATHHDVEGVPLCGPCWTNNEGGE